MAIALCEAGSRGAGRPLLQYTFAGKGLVVFRADLLVNNQVIVELKAARAIESAFEAQLMNYLRATKGGNTTLDELRPQTRFQNSSFLTMNARTRGKHGPQIIRMNTDEEKS